MQKSRNQIIKTRVAASLWWSCSHCLRGFSSKLPVNLFDLQLGDLQGNLLWLFSTHETFQRKCRTLLGKSARVNGALPECPGETGPSMNLCVVYWPRAPRQSRRPADLTWRISVCDEMSSRSLLTFEGTEDQSLLD